MKEFFNIKSDKYEFDYNDIRCLLTVINVILILKFGLSIAYIGLAIAVFGMIRDLICEERKINSTIQHLAMVVLNLYFVSLMQKLRAPLLIKGVFFNDGSFWRASCQNDPNLPLYHMEPFFVKHFC